MNEPTNKNHYIPCFWSALWNEKYFNLKVLDYDAPKPRKQTLYVLNVKSNKIYPSKTEKVFYTEQLGHIPITHEEYLELSKLDSTLSSENSPFIEGDENIIMDIENHFSSMEESIGYEYILKIIKDSRTIDNYENKVKISALLFYHPYRSYRYLLDLYEKYSDYENYRFRALYEWKYLMDKFSHSLRITKILEGKWTVYSLQDFCFPICDNPILNDCNVIHAVISPKHLIKIELQKKDKRAHYRSKIGCLEYGRILRKIIENTDTVIANGDKSMLEKIQKSRMWQNKIKI